MGREQGPADWRDRLRREAIRSDFHDFDLRYHVSLWPAHPPEYGVGGLVAITFRLATRPRLSFVTALDPAAALRLGARLGLDDATALAMVDSHERVHVALQLEGVKEDVEEAQAHFADAAFLALRHPRAADLVRANEFGVISRVGPDFWEALIARNEPQRRTEAHRGR